MLSIRGGKLIWVHILILVPERRESPQNLPPFTDENLRDFGKLARFWRREQAQETQREGWGGRGGGSHLERRP